MTRITYGATYQLSDFFGRIISKSGTSKLANLFFCDVLDFLKKLDEIQQKNHYLTLFAQVGGGITVTWRGEQIVAFLPAKDFLRAIVRDDSRITVRELIIDLDEAAQADQLMIYIEPKVEHNSRGWRIRSNNFPTILHFFNKLEEPAEIESELNHPRFFPGDIREAALTAFEREGRRCRGVSALGRPPHEITTERIEFDHVIPYSRGGPSTAYNLQILCQECNRLKRATAL